MLKVESYQTGSLPQSEDPLVCVSSRVLASAVPSGQGFLAAFNVPNPPEMPCRMGGMGPGTVVTLMRYDAPTELGSFLTATEGDRAVVASEPLANVNHTIARQESNAMNERMTVERDGHVLLIGINRPEKRNAFDILALEELAEAYETLGKDPELRVGVVYAHGDHFSAGLDLAQVGPVVAEKGPQALAGSYAYDPFGVWKDPVPKPVVMAVNGIAFTLSIELALASDIVIAAADVRFRQLEIGRGILPFGGATMRAPAQLGWGNAMRFLLTGEEFGAAEALRIALVQEVVAPGKHVERAREIAQLIARQAPLGVQGTLANARVLVKGGSEGGDGAPRLSLASGARERRCRRGPRELRSEA